MVAFSLQDAQVILASEAKLSAFTSFTNHSLGLAIIRLIDIESDDDAQDLDPKRLQQVKWMIRERGICSTDAPIILVSNDHSSTEWLRQRISPSGASLASAVDIGPSRVSTGSAMRCQILAHSVVTRCLSRQLYWTEGSESQRHYPF